MSTKPIKCVVSGHNANGQPDFWFVVVQATQEQYDNGEHYSAAKAHACENDFEAAIVYDENDPPEPLFDMFTWESASVVDVNGDELKE